MKKHEFFTMVLLIILLIITINQGSAINRLRNTMNQQTHQISNLQNNIQSIHGSVNQSLSNWERENRWLHSSRNIIKSISDDGEIIEVAVNWQFNDLKHDEEVYLMVGEKTNQSEYQWEKIKVDTDQELHFKKTLTLPLRNDYKLDVIAEDGEGRRLAELGKVNFYSSLQHRFQVHGNIRPISGDRAHIFVDLFSEGPKYLFDADQLSSTFVSKLEIASVFVEVYSNDQLVKNFDILEKATERGSVEVEKRHGDYPAGFMHLYQDLEIEGFQADRLSAVVKIVDGLGETYEFPLR